MRPVVEMVGPMVDGVHGGIHPLLLTESQFAGGLNLTARGGFVGTRPAFRRIAELASGTFQGAGLYRLNEGDRLVFVIDGRIYQIRLFDDDLVPIQYSIENTSRTKIDPSLGTETTLNEEFSPDFGKDDSGNWSEDVNMVKAERFFVVQDGYHQPAIIGENNDPNSARVSLQSVVGYSGSSPENESTAYHYSDVPIGKAMSYASRRLIVSPRFLWEDLTGVYPEKPSSGRMYFLASDLDSDPESCLRFIETNEANGGGALGLPLESGFIMATAPFRNSETVSGNGALVVLGQDGVSAFVLAYDRAQWGSTKQYLSQMLFQGVGTYSPRSVLAVNDDLLFRRPDGLASVRYTKSQMANSSGSLSVTPQSFEVSHRLNLDTFDDLPFVSAAFADNRVLLTTGGRLFGTRSFRGLVSLDTAALYSMKSAPSPVYDDLWTGVPVAQVLSGRRNGVETFFIFSSDGESNELWMVDKTGTADSFGVTETPILCRLYTRQFSFKDASIKKFDKAEVWIRDLVGDADITLYWRPDGYYLWKKTNVVSVSSDASGLPQSRHRLVLAPTSENPCDPATGRALRAGTSFQFCLEWRGSLKLEKALFFATPETGSESVISCTPETPVALVEGEQAGEVLDDYSYSSYGV